MEFVWIGILVLALVIEALTADLVVIWFCPGAIVSMILAFCDVSIWVQIPVFLVVGILLLISTRSLCRKWLQPKDGKTNTDLLPGQSCIVTEEICNREERGEVKLNGLRWSARSENPAVVIPVGEEVTVTEIRGVKLIVKK